MSWRSCLEVMHCHARSLSSVSITQCRHMRSRRVMEVMYCHARSLSSVSIIQYRPMRSRRVMEVMSGGHVRMSCIAMPALYHLSSVSITQYRLIGSRRVVEVMSGGHVLPYPFSLISHQSPSYSTVLLGHDVLWRSCLEVMHCHARSLSSFISLHHTVPAYKVTMCHGGHA